MLTLPSWVAATPVSPTADYLLRSDPTLRLAILEREIVGFGASGRNGGWCSSRFPVTPGMLEKRFGPNSARELLQAMCSAVDEVAGVCEREQIDVDFFKGGILRLARGSHQLPLIRAAYAGSWSPCAGWLVRYMQTGLQRIDENLEEGRPQPRDASIAEFLMKH